MSTIARIGEIRAHEGQTDALRAFILEIIVPGVRNSAGCIGCQVWQRQDDPHRFMIVEEWESTDAHQNAVRDISPEEIERFRTLVDDASRGAYWESVG